MAWYYVSSAGRTGPVTDSELATLARNGTVTPGTLVWTDGQPDWMPLSSARPDLLAGEVAGVNVPVVGGVALAGANKDMTVQRMREGFAPGVEAAKYAGFWIRLVAKFIDGIALQVVLLPLQFMLGAGVAASTDAGAASAAGGLLYLLFSIAVPLAYTGFMTGKFGATLGKMALGLKVVNPDMTPVGMGRAFGRAAGEWVSSLVLGIGYLIAAFDSEKRALHDHIASTRVISTR
jgi:uncharacterized RDD family membrane protein YckC